MDSNSTEDLRLPNAVVTRLIRDAIPPGVNVSKEVKTAIARSAAIFVVHATAYANEYAVAQKRKNITATDVFHAVRTLECDDLVKPMAEAMEKFKVQQAERRKRNNANRRSNAAAKSSASASTADVAQKHNGDENGDSIMLESDGE